MDKDVGEWCHLQGLGRLVAHVARNDSRVVYARLWLHPLRTTHPFVSCYLYLKWCWQVLAKTKGCADCALLLVDAGIGECLCESMPSLLGPGAKTA